MPAMASDRPVVLLVESDTQQIDHARRARLSKRFDFLTYDCRSVDEFLSRLQPGQIYSNIQAILRTGWLKSGPYKDHQIFTTEVIQHFPPSLKLVCCSGHGFDFADIDLLTERGIWYCNTPNAGTEAVANTALSLVLDTFRYLTYSQWCARYDWKMSRELGLKAVDPQGQALGIIGLGDIGLSIAQKCEAGLGMCIHYHGPRRKIQAEKQLIRGAIFHASLGEMLKTVDCVVIAAPYTTSTHHLLSNAEFNMAKSSGLRVVNIARGKMIDEAALLDALKEGKVIGVGLDVHENEPEVNKALGDNWRVTLYPHIGICSKTSWTNFEKGVFDSLEEYFDFGRPTLPVNNLGN